LEYDVIVARQVSSNTTEINAGVALAKSWGLSLRKTSFFDRHNKLAGKMKIACQTFKT
jgi:hypothetical protein